MVKGAEYTGVVARVDFPNKGIVEVGGEDSGAVSVKNLIPGQKVRVVVTRKRGERMEGRLREVLEKSSLETVEDICPHYGLCGGCLYQTVSPEDQRALKVSQVKRLLHPVCPELPFEGIFAGPFADGYRNKMEYTFGDEEKDGAFALGMHKSGSFYDIVTTDRCRLVHEDFRRIHRAAKEYFEKAGIPFYHKVQRTGYLRHFLVRRSFASGEMLVDVITTTQMPGEEEKTLMDGFVECLRALSLEGRLAGVLHTRNDSLADAVRDEGTDLLWGQDYITEKILGLSFRITPFSFFQTNSAGAEVLYGKTREYAMEGLRTLGRPAGTIFDLYSGTGTIAQLMAPAAKKVVGVEIVPEAVEAARENAGLNGLDNCEFIAGDVLKVVDELPEKPDLMILDPPRDGIHPKAIGKLIAFNVPCIVYVSCKPTSLARDLEILQNAGYRVERCCCVDMFTSTANIETVCLLSKLSDAKNHISVKFDMDEMDVTAAESKATYQEIQEWVREKYGFHVTHLNIAQVKRKNGIIERENYNKPKSEASRQPGCPEEKEQAIEEAMKHFQMII